MMELINYLSSEFLELEFNVNPLREYACLHLLNLPSHSFSSIHIIMEGSNTDTYAMKQTLGSSLCCSATCLIDLPGAAHNILQGLTPNLATHSYCISCTCRYIPGPFVITLSNTNCSKSTRSLTGPWC